MVNRISVWGIIAALIHLGFVGAVFVYVADCQGMFCEAGILLAVLPWFFLFDEVSLPIDGHTLFWFLVALDTLLLYFIFAALQKRMKTSL